MPTHPTIADRLDDRAANADPERAAELRKAAKKLTAFSRAPGKRTEADRMAAVLTPAVVEALGDALLALRADELADPPHALLGLEFRQADHALAALLIGAATDDLADPAEAALGRLSELIPELAVPAVEHVHYLTGLYPDVAAARRLREVAWSRLAQEPGSPAELWARSLGLDMPDGFWSIALSLSTVDHDRRPGDVLVAFDIDNTPGRDTRWSLRIGAMNANTLGGNRGLLYSDTEIGHYDRGPQVRGALEPAVALDDIPRVIADLEAAHPELRYDRASLKGSGSPGRLVTAARKKALIAWLSPPA